MGLGGQPHAPAALPPEKRPAASCIRGLEGTKAGLNGCGKSRPPPPSRDSIPESAIACRYTAWATPAQIIHNTDVNCIRNKQITAFARDVTTQITSH
jgi:hypothetical protein